MCTSWWSLKSDRAGFSVGRRHHETLYVKRCWIKGGSQEGCGACNGVEDDVAAASNPGRGEPGTGVQMSIVSPVPFWLTIFFSHDLTI